MRIKHLLEGSAPKLPGAFKGVQVMTPQQFVAQSGDAPDQEVDEGLNEFAVDGFGDNGDNRSKLLASVGRLLDAGNKIDWQVPGQMGHVTRVQDDGITMKRWKMPHSKMSFFLPMYDDSRDSKYTIKMVGPKHYAVVSAAQGVAEGEEHLDRIRKLSGLDEATKLPAQQREFGGQEFQDYMKRIQGTPDLDKAGNVKVDKKGIEKYVSGKTKTDKYKLPYIHRSSVVEYLGPDGQTYDEDKVKQTLAIRPKSLLKQNEKMKHSNGELEQFFNIGFAALTGIALDESTNNLIVVNTCPGAGSCKVDCFAMKGGKIQFKNAWQSDGRILTYLLNDPDGFFNQLSAEIAKEERLGQKGGYNVTIRWHDAGDFFSPEYQDLAFKLAEQHPNVKFYAYTKMAGAALAQKPANFIINWSEGAHTSQEKQVKANDPTLANTKNSRIVPTELFGDLLAKDAKGNLAKGPDGQWVVMPDKLPELKQRLAKQYGLSVNSILGYDEWAAKTAGGKKETPVKYNVIIAPGEPDLTANSHGVLSTLLLRH